MDHFFSVQLQSVLDWVAVNPGIALGAILVSSLAVLGAVVYGRRVRGTIWTMGRAFNKIDNILRHAHGHWFYFREKSYQGAASSELSSFLKAMGSLRNMQDLTNCFEPASEDALQKALHQWQRDKIAFNLSLIVNNDHKTVYCSGVTCVDSGSSALLLWFSDISNYVGNLKAGQASLDAANGTIALQRHWLNAIPRPLWVRTKEGTLIDCNTYYANMFQLPREDVIAGNLCLWTSEGTDKKYVPFEAHADRVFDLRRHLIVDGDRRFFSLYEHEIPDGLWAGFGTDLTDAEKASTILEQHILAYREVLEQLSAGISVYGADGRLKFFNHAYSRFFDCDEKWLATAPTLAEVLDDVMRRRMLSEQADYPAFKKRQMALVNSLMHAVQELEHLPDGRTVRRISAPHPMGGIFFIFEDVTTTLTLERQYNTQLAVHRASLDHLHEGVAVFGSDNRLRLFNPAFARLWHLPTDKVVAGTHIAELADLIRPFFVYENWAEQKNKIISKVTDRVPKKRRLVRSDGVVLDFSYVPLPDGSHLMSYVDVSDSCRIEQALSDRNEALETTEKLKTGFISSVSKELKTPLNVILGHAEILDEEYAGPLNAEQHGYCQTIRQSGLQLLHLVSDILDLAAIDAGQMTLNMEDVDLEKLFEGCWDLVRMDAAKKKIHFEAEYAKNLTPIRGDSARLRQVALNLFKNAIHYTPESGTITLVVEAKEKETLFTIIDTGMGIPRKDLRRIFRRFERSDAASATTSGAGLGLSLIKSIIDHHGGKIKIRSKPQVGTAITCHLPTDGIDVHNKRDRKDPLSLTDAA